jgi:hypothetical protein|tara:strand:+ start:1085 stop:1678 length:594 start_codon:yes stop_codon:yes gene_type:complete
MFVNKKTLFVHIPRTAGRYVGYLLEQNGYFCYHNDHLITWRGRELTHLTFPEHEVYLLQSPIKKFTIIREPVDRCISTLISYAKVNEDKINQVFKTQESFDSFVNECRVNDPTNWFVPQVNFIDYKTKIWRYEDKLFLPFYKWLYKNFNIKIEDRDYNSKQYIESIKSPIDNKVDLTEKQKSFIKNYYYQDYKLLNY